MSHLKSNLESLAIRQKDLAVFLGSLAPSPDFKPVPTPNGDWSGTYKGLNLHSPYDPVKEALRILETWENPDLILLGGFGLGYHAQVLSEKSPHLPLVICEPDPALLRSAMEKRDLRTLLSRENIHFFLGSDPSAIHKIFEVFSPGQPQLFLSRSQQQTNPGYFDGLKAEITALVQMRQVNKSTGSKYMSRWIGNALRSWPLMTGLSPARELWGHYIGCTAVVAAAGPSLEAGLSQIRQYRDKILLICVDTALNRLLSEGLDADFLVSTDPQYWNSRHLDNWGKSSAVPLGELVSPPVLWRKNPSKGLVFSTSVPFLRDLESKFSKPLGNLPSGGSVATTAWQFALALGASQVVFTGLDLAYPNMGTHIKGSHFEEASHWKSIRINPAATTLGNTGGGAQSLIREDWYGNPIATDVRMDLYRKWFSNQAQSLDQNKCLILRPQGQKIQGFKPVDAIPLGNKIPNPLVGSPLGEPESLEPLVQILGEISNNGTNVNPETFQDFFQKFPHASSYFSGKVRAGLQPDTPGTLEIIDFAKKFQTQWVKFKNTGPTIKMRVE